MNSTTAALTEAAQRALAQWDDLEVKATSTPGVFLVANHATGKAYRVTASSCDCPHHQRRGVPCKHMARIAAKLAARTHWATDEAEEKRAQAARDRALWD